MCLIPGLARLQTTSSPTRVRKQIPKQCDLDEITEHQHDRHRRYQPARLVLRVEPSAKAPDRERDQWPGGQCNTDRVASERAESRIERFELRIEKSKLKHNDWKQREQNE